jgi:hypothetical protein
MPDDRRRKGASARPSSRLPLRIAAAAVPCWLIIAPFVFDIGWPIEIVIGIVLAVALASPSRALILVCAVAPAGGVIAAALGVPSFRAGEAIAVALLAGWCVRASPDRPGPRMPAPIVAWVFVATVVVSILGGPFDRARAELLTPAFGRLTAAYFLIDHRIALAYGARLVEGVALAAATIALVRQHPRLAVTIPAAFAASGIAFAIAFGFRGAIRPGAGVAGPYLLAVVCTAAGVTVRARGRDRTIWIGLAVIFLASVWVSEWRSVGEALANALPANDFGRIRAAFGAIGLVAFGVWNAAALVQGGRALWHAPHDPRLLGIMTGVLVLLGASAIGRPLLDGDAAVPFWILFGLMIALAGSSLLNQSIEILPPAAAPDPST